MYTTEEKKFLGAMTPKQYVLFNSVATQTTPKCGVAFCMRGLSQEYVHPFVKNCHKYGLNRALSLASRCDPTRKRRGMTVTEKIMNHLISTGDWATTDQMAVALDTDVCHVRAMTRKLWQEGRLRKQRAANSGYRYKAIQSPKASDERLSAALGFIRSKKMVSVQDIAKALKICPQHANHLVKNLLVNEEIYVAHIDRQRRYFAALEQ